MREKDEAATTAGSTTERGRGPRKQRSRSNAEQRAQERVRCVLAQPAFGVAAARGWVIAPHGAASLSLCGGHTAGRAHAMAVVSRRVASAAAAAGGDNAAASERAQASTRVEDATGERAKARSKRNGTAAAAATNASRDTACWIVLFCACRAQSERTTA